MDLKKTTVLSLHNPSAAQAELRQWIHDQPHVLFIVLGNGPISEQLLQKADKFAGAQDDLRWVVWAREPQDVSPVLLEMKGDPALLGKLQGCLGFTLSLMDEVADVILPNETIDNVRVNLAYVNAEALTGSAQ